MDSWIAFTNPRHFQKPNMATKALHAVQFLQDSCAKGGFARPLIEATRHSLPAWKATERIRAK